MKYDVDYFLNKFEAIPEEKWITGDLEFNGCHCALGHAGVVDNGSQWVETEESIALAILLGGNMNISPYDRFRVVYRINDNKVRYNHETPKQRILAALNDVKNGTF